MTPLIAFGEALVDMLSNRLDGAADDLPETFTPYAGGAPANVAVACARLGLPSRFLGMVGEDRFGENRVDTRLAQDLLHATPVAREVGDRPFRLLAQCPPRRVQRLPLLVRQGPS